LQPLLGNKLKEYPKRYQGVASSGAFLLQQVSHEIAFPSGYSPQQVVLVYLLPGQVWHLTRLLSNCFVNHVDIFHMYPEIGNDNHTDIQHNFLEAGTPSVIVTTPTADGTSLNLTASKCAITTQMFWVLNTQWQAFTYVVQSGQNSVAQTWSLNMGPGGDKNHTCDLHLHSGVAQMRILHCLMSQPNIITWIIYWILVCYEDHTAQLTEDRDALPADNQSWLIVKTVLSISVSLDVQLT
jgi:hypothetical protein